MTTHRRPTFVTTCLTLAALAGLATPAVAGGGPPRLGGGGEPAPSDGPTFIAYQTPLGKAADHPRVVEIITKTAVQQPWQAANKICDEILERQLEPDQIFILLQRFGMGDGDPADNRPEEEIALFRHHDDALPTDACEQWWMTTWMSKGIAECREWMDEFVEHYQARQAANPAIPDPHRFHFDTEMPVVPQYSARGTLEAFVAMKSDPRWNSEPIAGFGGATLAELYAQAGAPKTDVNKNWGQTPNEDWAVWYGAVCYQAMEAAMDQAAYAPIREAWPNCKSSNFDNSGAYDGVGSPARLRPAEGYEWFTFSYRPYGEMAAPRCYWHLPSLVQPGEKLWEATVRRAQAMVSRSGASFDRTPADVVPWIQLTGNVAPYLDGTKKMTSKCMFNMLSMLHDEEVAEIVIWSNTSTQDSNAHWNLFVKMVDAIWGRHHTDLRLEQGAALDDDGSLLNGADALTFRVNASPNANGTRRARIRFGFALDTATSPDQIKVTVKSEITRPVGTGKIMLHNWLTGEDELVEEFQVENELGKAKVKVDAAPYLSESGRVEVVLVYQHNDSFKAKLDMVRVSPVSQDIE